jgi:hypothetical protein
MDVAWVRSITISKSCMYCMYFPKYMQKCM